MNVRVCEYLCDLNQRYQQMLDTLRQLAVHRHDLKAEDFALYELRLKELQSDSNAQVLEQLLRTERQTFDSLHKQRTELERQVSTTAEATAEEKEPDGVLRRWMENTLEFAVREKPTEHSPRQAEAERKIP